MDGVNLVPGRRPATRGTGERPAAQATADGDGASARRPRGARTRQQLLDAGAVVLPARGYHDARVDDIVAAAGVSHGTFYRYFDNKDDFFKVLAQQASTELVELLAALADAGVGDPTALRGWLDAWFGAYESNGGVISTWQEMRTDGDLTAFSQDVAAAVVAQLRGLLEPRSFGDPAIDAFPLLALLERLPYSVFTLQFMTRTEATDAMVTILRQGLFGLPGAR
jgi:AcrR family transcriptional regulator